MKPYLELVLFFSLISNFEFSTDASKSTTVLNMPIASMTLHFYEGDLFMLSNRTTWVFTKLAKLKM